MFKLSLPGSPRKYQNVFLVSSPSRAVTTENTSIAPWLKRIITRINTKISELDGIAKNIELALGIDETDVKESKLIPTKSIKSYLEWYSHSKFLEFVSHESIDRVAIIVSTAKNELSKLKFEHIEKYKSLKDELKKTEEKLNYEKQLLIKELMCEPKKQLAKMTGSPSKTGISTWAMHGTPAFIEAVKAKVSGSMQQTSRPKGEEAKKFKQLEDYLQVTQGIARFNLPKQNPNNRGAVNTVELSLFVEEMKGKSLEELRKLSEQIQNGLLSQRAKTLIDDYKKNEDLAKELEIGEFEKLEHKHDYTAESCDFASAKKEAAELMKKITKVEKIKQAESKDAFLKINEKIKTLSIKILDEQKRLDTANEKFLNANINTNHEVNNFDVLDEFCMDMQGEIKANEGTLTDIESEFVMQKNKFFGDDSITSSMAENTLKSLQEVAKHNKKLKDTVLEAERVVVHNREVMKKKHVSLLQKEIFLILKSAVFDNNDFWRAQVSRWFDSRYTINMGSTFVPKGISMIFNDFRNSVDENIIDVIDRHKRIIEDRMNSWQHFFGLRRTKTNEFYALVLGVDLSIPVEDPIDTLKVRRDALKQRLVALGLTIRTEFDMVAPAPAKALKA